MKIKEKEYIKSSRNNTNLRFNKYGSNKHIRAEILEMFLSKYKLNIWYERHTPIILTTAFNIEQTKRSGKLVNDDIAHDALIKKVIVINFASKTIYANGPAA